jgi:hypothetical protein
MTCDLEPYHLCGRLFGDTDFPPDIIKETVAILAFVNSMLRLVKAKVIIIITILFVL